MRFVRFSFGVLCFGLVAGLGVPTAAADDCHCDGGFHGGSAHRHHHHHGRSTSCRDPYHPSTRYVIPRRHGRHHGFHRGCSYGYGTPWSALRRGLRGRGTAAYRKWYVGQYFYRRYPFAVADVEEARVDALLAQADEAGESAAPLPAEALLRRGMARFYVADHRGAQEDFEAVLAAKPKEARARFGHLFVAVSRSDWATAVRDLNTLAIAGELKKDDRVVAEGTFNDPKRFEAIVRGLVGHARYRITDGDAHLVAAWALAVTGDEKSARSYARLARRWKASNAALPVIERNLGIATKPAPAKAAPPEETSPVRAPRPKGEPAGRVVAQAKPG